MTTLGLVLVPFSYANAQAEILGNGLAGTNGVPIISGFSDTYIQGDSVDVTLSNALANTSGALVIGATASYSPLLGGVLVPSPNVVIPITTDSFGGFFTQVDLPTVSTAYLQLSIVDSGATQGLALSTAMAVSVSGQYRVPEFTVPENTKNICITFDEDIGDANGDNALTGLIVGGVDVNIGLIEYEYDEKNRKLTLPAFPGSTVRVTVRYPGTKPTSAEVSYVEAENEV